MNRRNLLIAIGAALTFPRESIAQQQDRIRRIGFLAARSRSTPSNPDIYYDAFVQGMRDLGHVEGKNLLIEWRFSDGKYEHLSGLAAELVRTKPEVLVTHSSPAVLALQRATDTIPIVCSSMGDPVGSGFAASLARPGGNITGLSIITMDVYAKQFELLKSMLPSMSLAGVLVNPSSSRGPAFLKSVQAAAQAFGVKTLPVEARTPDEIERGFVAMKQGRADAVIIQTDSMFLGQRRQIAELAARHRLPSMSYYREVVEAGGLMSYGQNAIDFYRRSATYVDKIFKGAKPGDLPIEQPMTIHLAINRKTAKALGITVPQGLLVRANELID